MARVVLVDRSAASRRLVRSVLECEHDIEIVEEFVDTVDLTQYLLRSTPDLVLIDSHILSQGGFEVIESIMSETPLPILLLSELDQDTQGSDHQESAQSSCPRADSRFHGSAYPFL